MHLVRLLNMSIEILSGKGVLVDRTNIDRDHLMSIRNGYITFDQIEKESEELKKKGDELYLNNVLPIEPDYIKINNLLTETLDEHLGIDSRIALEHFDKVVQ